MKTKVVVIGQSYSSRLSIVRSVAQLDCEITVVVTNPENEKNPKRPIDCYSKYITRVLYCQHRDEKTMISLLMDECKDPNQKVVLIPDGDDVVAAIDNNREVLQEFFAFPYVAKEPASLSYWMEKFNQKNLAREVGLNVANGIVIEIVDGHFTIPEAIHYPCFVKPLASWTGRKWGMRRCNNEEDLKSCLNFTYSNWGNIPLLVEDFLTIDREFATLGFSDGTEVIIPGLLELLHIGHGKTFGVAWQGSVFPITGYEDLVEKFKELVKRIGFVGLFDIDFFESNGVMYFCELNLRYGGSGYAFTRLGVNLPVMMIKSFMGESIDGMNKTISGEAKYFNERIAIEEWYNGYLTTDEYNTMKSGSDIKFVEDEEDPAPQKVLDREIRLRSIKRSIKKLIRR